MISNLKLKAWMILLLFIFVVGILYLVGTNADEFTEAIKTPPVTDAQLATTVADYNKAQIAQIESLKSETHELKVELAAVKSEVFLQSKRMEELTNNIRAVRTELEIVKTQRTVAPKPEAKINPATHPMVAAQLQNKKPAPGTLDTEIAKNLGKGRTASELTPDEQKKLSKLKKNALMEKLASRKVAPETKPTPNAGLMKKLKGQPKALPSKSFSDSLQTLKKVLQNKEIKRPGKGEYTYLSVALHSGVRAKLRQPHPQEQELLRVQVTLAYPGKWKKSIRGENHMEVSTSVTHRIKKRKNALPVKLLLQQKQLNGLIRSLQKK